MLKRLQNLESKVGWLTVRLSIVIKKESKLVRVLTTLIADRGAFAGDCGTAFAPDEINFKREEKQNRFQKTCKSELAVLPAYSRPLMDHGRCARGASGGRAAVRRFSLFSDCFEAVNRKHFSRRDRFINNSRSAMGCFEGKL